MSVPPWLPRVLLGALAAVLLIEVIAVVPHPAVILLVVSGLWMAAPGVVLLRRVFAAADPSGIAGWLMGPAFGFGFSVFGVFLLWALGLQNWIAILLGPALTWLMAWVAQRFGVPDAADGLLRSARSSPPRRWCWRSSRS